MHIVFNTRKYIDKAWNIAEKLSVGGDVSTQFKGAMLYSTLNICDAMQMLIQKRNFVSANILFRSLYEYVFRGYWLNRIADEHEIALAIEQEKWPKTKALHALIEGKNTIIDLLANEKTETQNILHSYIHGGSQNPLGQLGSGRYIEPNIPDSEVSYLLKVVQLSTYVALSEMMHLSGTDEFEAELVQIVEEVIGEKLI
ncbi:MAG: hypothetical protein ABW078_16675 [Sedimenticola sp.]